MASSSKGKKIVVVEEEGDEDETLEDLERFDDFTLASSWERFISDIEAVCRLWMVDGSKNLLEKGPNLVGSPANIFKVTNELKYNAKSYSMEYYFMKSSTADLPEWSDDLHKLQLSFGVKEFLVIAPLSASGVVLDTPEATKLLSSVAIALSNCGSVWPALVPVHDPSRKAYIGIQNLGTVFTRRFEADRIGSQVPIKLMHLEGLYELFLSKFAFLMADFSTSFFKVHFSMKLTYTTPPHDDEDEMRVGESEMVNTGGSDDNIRSKVQWDDDCPWTEWYSAEDPLKCFELTAIWSGSQVESSLDMAELENASLLEAEKWLLLPILSSNLNVGMEGHRIGFASQLKLLVNAFEMSFSGQFMEDFVSVENRGSEIVKSSSAVPPPTVLDRVLKDLFQEGNEILSYGKGEHKNSRAIKGAPLESIFAQFCLHSLWFGSCSIHAIAFLWIEFVREVRWCWEESQLLPRMLSNCGIDLSTCLIHQKLQMLAICIAKKGIANRDIHDEKLDRSESEKLLGQERRGSAGFAGSMMLLKIHERMHAPYTQDALIMTEDMHEERMHALEAFGSTYNFSAHLEKDVLSSDMSAFKAANPSASFEDFIRWHSPGDWEDEENPRKVVDGIQKLNPDDWPPRGRLSHRMSEGGNSWRQIWNNSPVLPVSEQKPLFDPNREGEKILHYLETLRPDELLRQMICTAFRAAADTLNQTTFGNVKEMETKVSQLYLTMASTLKPLRGNHLPDKAGFVSDLNRLCLLFEHIEVLLTVAASIHRKLVHAPHLCKAIFIDIFNFYLPRMGTSLVESNDKKEFKSKQVVRMSERDAITSLFPPPTANQSWRKVLSMGNLLNGHEPIMREIIFSVYNSMRNSHYEASSPWGSLPEVETHRMYICGTSNDLQVALSVTSCD